MCIIGICSLLLIALLITAFFLIRPRDDTHIPDSSDSSGEGNVPDDSESNEEEYDYSKITTREFITQAPTLPIPTADAGEEEWIAFFRGLLMTRDSWYHFALSSTYERAADIDLSKLFLEGTAAGRFALTNAEKDFLTGKLTMELDITWMPASEVDSVLDIYFDVAYEDCTKKQPESLIYFEQTDRYYINSSYPILVPIQDVIEYSVSGDGLYTVRYASGHFETEYFEVVLKKLDNHFKVVSNLPSGDEE